MNEVKSLEERVAQLEEKVEELGEVENSGSDIRWDGVTILGIWLAVLVMCFSPIGAANFR